MSVREYTPTERRILTLLSDGRLHGKDELRTCLNDDLSETSLNKHLTRIRKKIRPLGQDIMNVQNGVSCYRLVRLINTTD